MSYPKCPECAKKLQNEYGIVQDSIPPKMVLTCKKCDQDFLYSPRWGGESMVLEKIKNANIDVSFKGEEIISKITLTTQPEPIYACKIIGGPND